MKKSRIDIRKHMKQEKKAMHKLEAEQIKIREEREAHRGRIIINKPMNFHRPVFVVEWNAPKRVRYDSMNWPRIYAPAERRNMADAREQLRENMVVPDETDCVDTCEVIYEPMPKVTVQKRIRPGGRVERRMRRLEQKRMEEDDANAKEFAKAVCEMHITPKMLREQKGDNL